jgi:hypothetical protein
MMEPLEAQRMLSVVSIEAVTGYGTAKEQSTVPAQFTISRADASGELYVSYSITFGTASAGDISDPLSG